ncbi:MAG: rod shape-determining protein [Firmicutes bacterium]|jgi:rod shape-determining protein MreB|nr:rod shape-determining protein [Bacillota bacterium]
MFWSGLDIGIDLGTASVLVYVRGRGIVLRETSVVAFDEETGRVVAVGDQARDMIGRNPSCYRVVRPMKDGVIADYDVTLTMLRYLISRVAGKRPLLRPRVAVCVPARVTSVERRAVLEATVEAGAKQTFLIEEPMAAAIGAGLDVSGPVGNIIVDVGGGTTDIAVISLGGLVVCDSLRVGGDKCDDAIIRFVRKEHNLMIGDRTAEEIKIRIGAAIPGICDLWMEVRGRDLVTGLPRVVTITSDDVAAALAEPIGAMVEGVRGVLERTPPELSVDIADRGIVLTGGGSLLKGFDRLLSDETGVPACVAEDPITCVVRGTGKFLEGLEGMRGRAVREGMVVASRSV